MNEIVIFGTGGHAKVVHDVIQAQGQYKPVCFFSSDTSKALFLGLPVIDQNNLANTDYSKGIIAIGDNAVREWFYQFLKKTKPAFELISAIHPKACVAADVSVGGGTVVMAGSVLNSGTFVGEGVIINTGSVIDHDCRIGSWSSIAPGCVLGGNVTVGRLTAVSLGACIIHGRRVGDQTVIGAGSLVLNDIESSVLAYGSPCKVIRSRAFDEKYL